MKNRNHILFGAGRVLLVLWLSPVISRAADPDPEALKEILRARDAAFDNAVLEYRTKTVLKMPAFPVWKYPGLAKQLNINPETNKDQEFPAEFDEKLTVRGGDATFLREADMSLLPKQPQPGQATALAYQKWSNSEGKQREIADNRPKGGEKSDMTLDIRASELPGEDVAQEQRAWVEFAHGMGLGKRIGEITSVRRDGPDLVVEGTLKLWRRDQSTFRAKLDQDYVARELKIEARVGEALNVIEARCEGNVAKAGMSFPQNGTMKRTMWGLAGGERVGNGKVITEFGTVFRGFRPNLTDAEYQTLTDMSVPPGTPVTDHISGMRYKAGQPIPLPEGAGTISRLSDLESNSAAAMEQVARAALEKEAGPGSSPVMAAAVRPDAETVRTGWRRGLLYAGSGLLVAAVGSALMHLTRGKRRAAPPQSN